MTIKVQYINCAPFPIECDLMMSAKLALSDRNGLRKRVWSINGILFPQCTVDVVTYSSIDLKLVHFPQTTLSMQTNNIWKRLSLNGIL